MQENFVIYNEEYALIKEILKSLKTNTRSEIAFITDSEGHCIASTGEMEDSHLNSISSLIAGSMAAVNGIGQMLNVSKFTTVLTESVDKNLHISLINDRTMLIVIFDNSYQLIEQLTSNTYQQFFNWLKCCAKESYHLSGSTYVCCKKIYTQAG